MERLPSLPSASLFLFLSLLSIGLDLSRPCKREGGRSEGERELAVGWGGDRGVMSPESGESPGKVIGALDVLNVQISAKKCALALPGGAGMEAALAPAVQSAGAGARLLHLAPGVLRGRRPGRAGPGGGGRAVPSAPRRAAKFGGGPAPAGPGSPGCGRDHPPSPIPSPACRGGAGVCVCVPVSSRVVRPPPLPPGRSGGESPDVCGDGRPLSRSGGGREKKELVGSRRAPAKF